MRGYGDWRRALEQSSSGAVLTYNQYDDIIRSESQRFNIRQTWIKAIIGRESTFNPRAYRAEPAINDASIGLMQILMGTARGLGFQGTEEELYDPATNIHYGTMLLAEIAGRCGTNFAAVYSAYNSGGCDNYRTNPIVYRNVEGAIEWLNRFEEEAGEKKTVLVSSKKTNGQPKKKRRR